MKVLQPSLSTRRRLNSEIDTLIKCLSCSFFHLVAKVCNRIALCIPLNQAINYAFMLKTLFESRNSSPDFNQELPFGGKFVN